MNPHSIQANCVLSFLAPENPCLVDKRNPDLPLELIFRILGEAGQPHELLFKDPRLGDLVEGRDPIDPHDIKARKYHKEIYRKAYWREIGKSFVSSCETIAYSPLLKIPSEIRNLVLQNELLTNIGIRRLVQWKEARDNIVILRILRGGDRKDDEDQDYESTMSKGRGKAFDEASAEWKRKKTAVSGLNFSFCRLNTLPKQFIDYLVTSEEHTLYLGCNSFDYLPDSFALLATSKLKFLGLDSNNLQKIPSWMENFKNLQTLALKENPDLPKESIEELKKKLPNCIILHDL